MRENRWLQALIILLVLIASVYLMQLLWQLGQRFAGVLLLFFLAWMISFVLIPAVEMLCRLQIPRIVAVSAVYLVLALIASSFVLLAVPSIVAQMTLLAGNVPTYADSATQLLDRLHNELVARGVSNDYVLGLAQSAVSRIDSLSAIVMRDSLSIAGGIASVMLKGIIVLVLSFYMTLDGRNIEAKLLSLAPPAYRGEALLFVESVGQSFGGFIRAQLVLAIVAGAITGLVMRLFGLGYVMTVAVLCGAALLVPLVGNIVALVPPLVIAAFQAPNNLTVLWLFLVLWAAQQVMLNVLGPRLLSGGVGLHPLLVFFAMLLGASAAGAWGAIFGVPVVAVGFIMARHFYSDVLLRTPLYAGKRRSVVVSDQETEDRLRVSEAGVAAGQPTRARG